MKLDFTAADVTPERSAVLAHLHVPPDAALSRRVEETYSEADRRFAELVAPTGTWREITREAFGDVYHGEGRNAAAGPVADIAPRADHLAMFAVTLGAPLGDALRIGFAAGELAFTYMLDAMASVAADTAAELAERRYEAALRERGWATPDGVALRYSPGYCGWDVTGQQRLFAYLQPAAIGLTLTDSCLMQPLKSVSGVLIAGPRTIHRFSPIYDFCEQCEDRTCRARLRGLFRKDAVRR